MACAFNQLSPAATEALALLSEEAGEIVQAVGKALRHGLDSSHPVTNLDNTTALEDEIGDLLAAVDIAVHAGLLSRHRIDSARLRKLSRVGQHLHHVAVPPKDRP